MLSVLPPRSGTAPISTLLRLVRVFCRERALLTFSTTAVSPRAASRSARATAGVSAMSCLLAR